MHSPFHHPSKLGLLVKLTLAILFVYATSSGSSPIVTAQDEAIILLNNLSEDWPRDAQSTTGPVPPQSVIQRELLAPQDQKYLSDVPAYIWHNGCGPTAAGMVLGYWDGQGFDNLVPGNAATQTAEVDVMISSTGNYSDYCLPLDNYPNLLADLSEPPFGDEHADDSVADFMETSQSYFDNYYGWSWFSDMDDALIGYVNLVAPEYSVTAENQAWGTFNWGSYRAEIDAGRPVILLVDTDANGSTDHFVTAIGYSDESGTNMYACRNTWDEGIHWFEFAQMESGQSWGIYGATLFQISGTLPPAPEMDVRGNELSIADGDSIPASTDNTDFGSALVSEGTQVRTFTIVNNGTADLTLNGVPKVAVGGTHASDFTVSSQPSSPVSPYGGTTTFTVTFAPGASGLRTATISIDNNDTNENPYTFAIQGTGFIDIYPAPYFDSMENGINNWSTTGFWHQVEQGVSPYPEAHSPTHSWWYGQDATGNYENGVPNSGDLNSPPIYIPNTGLGLHFWYWYQTESDDFSWDKKIVQISVNGGPFADLYQVAGGPMNAWEHSPVIDLSSYAGSYVQVRFQFDTVDGYGNDFRGWYIDDFAVSIPNDDFDYPFIAAPLPYSMSQVTTGTTTSSDDPILPCVTGQKDHTVWYRYAPTANGLLTVNTFGSSYNTVLAVWTGARGALMSHACNDDSNGTLQSQVQVMASAGTNYYIEIAGVNSASYGTLNLAVTSGSVQEYIYVPMVSR